MEFCKWMFLFFERSLIQKKVLEGLQGVGGAFGEIFGNRKIQ